MGVIIFFQLPRRPFKSLGIVKSTCLVGEIGVQCFFLFAPILGLFFPTASHWSAVLDPWHPQIFPRVLVSLE